LHEKEQGMDSFRMLYSKVVKGLLKNWQESNRERWWVDGV